MGSSLCLISGASGYVASHVVKEALVNGYNVRCTVQNLEDQEDYEHLYNLVPNTRDKVEVVEADFLDPEAWVRAVRGVDYILHIASPFPWSDHKSEEELITAATEGTLGVLRAAANEKSVKRVVVTSSMTAVAECGGNIKPYDESKWADPDLLDNLIYNKSQTIAERAAWDFHSSLSSDHRFELCTVNPAIVLGPPLTHNGGSSVSIIAMLMAKQTPMCLPLNFQIVDVRDVAKAQIKCLQVQEAAGHRHILTNKCLWMKEISEILNDEFKTQGYDLPLADMSPAMMLDLASTNEDLRMSYEFSSRPVLLDNTRFTKVLGVQATEIKKTIIDTAYALIEFGYLDKIE